MFENRKMSSVETVLRRGKGRQEKEGQNLAKIHCKYFYKCHNAPPAQQYRANKRKHMEHKT
jgi:hypothetical protein